MRWAHGAWALIFVASAGVQLNDPDPILWIAIYLAGAGVAAAAAVGKLRWEVAVAVAASAIAWAAWLVATTSDVGAPMNHGPGGFFAYEVVREVLGLGLVAGWTGVAAAGARAEGQGD